MRADSHTAMWAKPYSQWPPPHTSPGSACSSPLCGGCGQLLANHLVLAHQDLQVFCHSPVLILQGCILPLQGLQQQYTRVLESLGWTETVKPSLVHSIVHGKAQHCCTAQWSSNRDSLHGALLQAPVAAGVTCMADMAHLAKALQTGDQIVDPSTMPYMGACLQTA